MFFSILTTLTHLPHQWKRPRYDLILHGKLNFPSGVSARCKAFLEALLERDPARRLGGGAGGVAAVKGHTAFSHIDFIALENRELTPPFDPAVEGCVCWLLWAFTS